MDEHLVGTLTHGRYKAEVFSLSIPGEFRVAYQDSSGETIEEGILAGISSYKQRETKLKSGCASWNRVLRRVRHPIWRCWRVLKVKCGP